MTISPKTKKIVFISSGSILAMALFIWHFFPVLIVHLFWYQHDSVRQYLDLTPVSITALETSAKEWKNITIGDLTMKLPMSKYTKVGGKDTYMYFTSCPEGLVVSDIVPSKETLQMIQEDKLKYPVVSYRDYLAIFSSVPADVSFFNSRNKNTIASSNQILKTIAIPVGGISKILTVNTGTLKALCILSAKSDTGYSATTYVYSQNEKASLSLLLTRYEDKATLETDLLTILGGIRMPDHMADLNQVSKDINGLVTQYNKT
jgi:hypothetical protein